MYFNVTMSNAARAIKQNFFLYMNCVLPYKTHCHARMSKVGNLKSVHRIKVEFLNTILSLDNYLLRRKLRHLMFSL